MDSIVWTQTLFETLGRPGALEEPLLIAGFGSPEAQTPAAVVEYLVNDWDAQLIAELDPDALYDFTVARPNVLIEEGERVVEWPGVRFWHARPAGADRDVLLLAGREPHFRWQRITAAVGELAHALGVREAVVLGSFAAGVPHTRSVPVRMTGVSGRFATRAGIEPVMPRYQGPATMSMVLGIALRKAGFEAATLSAMAPFYFNAEPSPHAMAALIEVIDRGLGTRTSLEVLQPHRDAFDAQAALAMESTPAVAQLVANLERQYDEAPPVAPVLRADEVLADVEALLARQDGEAGGPGIGPPRRVW